jgi:adenylate cyclase
VTHEQFVPLIALIVYGFVLAAIVFRRGWRDTATRRLAFYLLLAMVVQGALIVSAAGDPLGDQASPDFKIFLSAQSALPLFFLAFGRAFIRVEQRPWAFLAGLGLWGAVVVFELLSSLGLISAGISFAVIAFILRTILWAYAAAYVIVLAMIERNRTRSPLYRNRLAFLAIALPFFFTYDALDLMIGQVTRPYAPALQIVGVVIAAYATLQHDLFDLRDLLRRSARGILIAAFTILVYTLVIGAVLSFFNVTDYWNGLASAGVAAVALALLFQPLRDLVLHRVERLLFGRRYDVRAVVQNFSEQLAAQIELDELAARGQALLREAMGAHDVALLLVSKQDAGYSLRVVPGRPDDAGTILLDAQSSVVNALVTRDAPLAQYDIDRLPQYADLPSETLAELQRLHGEVFVPIHSRGLLIGVWVIGARSSGDRYNSSDLALLTTLALQSAVALENARLLADLRDQMARLSSMRDYLDSTLASIATGVVTIDPVGKIISFNRAAQDIFRISMIDAYGKPYTEVLPPMEGAQLPLLVARLWAHASQHLLRDVITHVAGRGQVHLTLELSAIRRGQEMVGVAIVIEDQTEQARLEIERRAQEQETQRVRATFEHYVAPTVVEGLLTDSRRIMLGGERQMLTILFADIHGFTNLSEALPPEDLVEVLNGYLSLAYQSILRYEGTLDKFMGDGVMAIFNAPLVQSDHAWRAARAALALQREVAAHAPSLPPEQRLTFRVGVHTGEAIVGNIGAHDLMNYTAVGDTVNIAKRLQENADVGQILMSRSTLALVENKVVVRPRDKMTVRGREVPIEVFELVGAWE